MNKKQENKLSMYEGLLSLFKKARGVFKNAACFRKSLPGF